MRIRPLPRCTSNRKSQHGSAVLIILTIIGIGAAFLLVSALNKANQQIQRDKMTTAALVQAKEALIGFAAIYRDTHANEVFGFLPCPDTNNDGQADPPCGAADVSVISRLPWRTLGLPALRDNAGECLWYAISGRGKDNLKTAVFNWDATGQFIVQDAGGTTLAGTTPHERPLAVIFAPRMAIGGQTRASAGASECGGNNTVAAYLDGTDPIYAGTAPGIGADSILTVATAASIANGTNNDQGLWITNRDIFERIKKRSDFKSDIDTLVGDLANCLNNLPPSGLPSTSPTNKGVGDYPAAVPPPDPTPNDVLSMCKPTITQKPNVLKNWQDNLLYAKPATAATVNSATGCNAVLFFSGERTASQSRATAAEKLVVTNYLESGNATLFPARGTYTGATHFSSTSASTDVARCIKGLPAGATQKSFASDFASFVTAGVGVTTNAIDKTVTVADAVGTSGGCFWFPNTIPLAGKVLRAYYDYKFSSADTYALTGTGTDRGNGFTFQMVRNDIGAPTAVCGREANMGALALGASPGDMWGTLSFIIETDVHKDAGDVDPGENHTAIMAHGNLDHSVTNGNPTVSCNGSAAGCRHNPTNRFEESPSPLSHNQRIEIHTGCNASCSSCDPANHVAPNTYARITAWVDCTDCDDIVVDLDRAAKTPTINRCIILDTPLNSVYLGFTGGFRSGAAAQGVILRNFQLRSE